MVARRRVLLQQAHAFEQQVVEIERIRLAQALLVIVEDLGEPLGLGIVGLLVEIPRTQLAVLRPG